MNLTAGTAPNLMAKELTKACFQKSTNYYVCSIGDWRPVACCCGHGRYQIIIMLKNDQIGETKE